MTASPEHLKVMLVTDFPNYVKGTSLKRISAWMSNYLFVGEEFHEAMNTVLGSGVFNSDGTKFVLVHSPIIDEF